jgi:D-tyrosyl-tRNA(Tyr) deacylase
MRAVVQRVSRAKVSVEGVVVGAIEAGLCALIGVGKNDDRAHAAALAEKVVGLRIFEDAEGKMNHSLGEHGGALLAISQFTLFGDTRKGRRPSFSGALPPAAAEPLFEHFCEACRALGVQVETGRFRTQMRVELVNEGPVTLLIDSERTF